MVKWTMKLAEQADWWFSECGYPFAISSSLWVLLFPLDNYLSFVTDSQHTSDLLWIGAEPQFYPKYGWLRKYRVTWEAIVMQGALTLTGWQLCPNMIAVTVPYGTYIQRLNIDSNRFISADASSTVSLWLILDHGVQNLCLNFWYYCYRNTSAVDNMILLWCSY